MKVVIVAGGSGHLGSTLVRSLISDGFHVVNLSRRSLKSRYNFQHEQLSEFELDLNNDERLKEIIDDSSLFSRIDGLINLAGRGTRGVSHKMSGDEFSKSLVDGVLPTFNTINTLNERIRDGGSIINFGSLWGLVSPKRAMYLDLGNEPSLSVPAAKAAIMQQSLYWATLLASRSIRVNCVVPGWFPAPRGTPRADYIVQIESNTPLARIGTPEDLIGAIKFLLNSESGFVTAQNLIIDGGYLAW